LQRGARLLPEHFEAGLTQLIGHGLVTCDSFGGLRRLITPPSRRKGPAKSAPLVPAGRWSPFRPQTSDGAERSPAAIDDALVEFTAHQLLARYGVVFRRLVERERIPCRGATSCAPTAASSCAATCAAVASSTCSRASSTRCPRRWS
jgi:ATP-dependent Lhr-like helicase